MITCKRKGSGSLSTTGSKRKAQQKDPEPPVTTQQEAVVTQQDNAAKEQPLTQNDIPCIVQQVVQSLADPSRTARELDARDAGSTNTRNELTGDTSSSTVSPIQSSGMRSTTTSAIATNPLGKYVCMHLATCVYIVVSYSYSYTLPPEMYTILHCMYAANRRHEISLCVDAHVFVCAAT